MDYVMRIFVHTCKSEKISFINFKYRLPSTVRQEKEKTILDRYGYCTLDWIGYADDLVIAFADNVSLQKGIILLDEIFKHLKINISKTKTMVMNWGVLNI